MRVVFDSAGGLSSAECKGVVSKSNAARGRMGTTSK
jgi:hypothetical protein